MPAQGQKGKGKRKRKPAKPYDRPKGFITKVKDFFNPWTWSKPLEAGTQGLPVPEEDAASVSSDSDTFESAPSSPMNRRDDAHGEAGDFEDPTLTPSVSQYRPSDDPRYASFKSKADIGNLTVDILSDQRVESIFGNVNSDSTVQPPRSFGDISSQALMPSDMSTRATAGSDYSSQASISEVDPNETGSVSSIVGGAAAKGNKMGQSSSSRKYLSTSLAFGSRGRLSLFTPHSSLQSLRERQGTAQRRSLLANSSMSANLFTSTPRLAEERRSHQVATPLSSLHAPQSSAEGSTAEVDSAAEEEIFTTESSTVPLPAFVTPTRKRSSLSRTPFNSPFYQSGRTPYFSETGQKKRGRPESPSSPELPPLRQKATAKPLASNSATTQTAKKILLALESISSPLENVRRLPPRLPVQPSAKRRKAELPDALAPPTDPLQSAVPVRLLPPLSTTPELSAFRLDCQAVEQVLRHFRDRFIEEMDAIAIVFELEHKEIISDSDLMMISNSPSRIVQNQILHAHLMKTCTVEALMSVCDTSIAVPGNPKMNALGRAMKNMLEGGTVPSAGVPSQPPKLPSTTLLTAPSQPSVFAGSNPPNLFAGSNPPNVPTPLLQSKRQGGVMGKMASPRRRQVDGQFSSPLDNSNPLELPPPIPLLGLKSAPKLSITPTQPSTQSSMTSTKDSLKMSSSVPPPSLFSSTLGAPQFSLTAQAHGTDLLPPSSVASQGEVVSMTTTKVTTHMTAHKASSLDRQVTPPKTTPSLSVGGPFTFAPPTQMSPARVSTDNCNKPYIFSPPQVCVGVSTQTATPLLPAPNKGTAPQLPQSALDALNKFKEAGEKMAAEDEAGYSPSPEVVALSSDDEDKDETACAVDLTVSPEETGKGEQKSLAFKPLEHLAPPTGSWSCDTCLVNNKEGDTKCCACGTAKPGDPKDSTHPSTTTKPLSSFSASAAQWTCEACLVPNKEDADQCVCCGTKKPGSAPKEDSKGASGVALGPAGGLKLNFPVPTSSSGGLKLNFPIPTSNSGGLKLNFPVPTSNSGGLKLNFPVPTSSSDAVASSGIAGGLKLNFPISKDETSTVAPSTEGATGGMGLGLKFPVPTSATSTSAGAQLKLSTGGLNFSTGGLGAFAQASSSNSSVETQKIGSSGSAGFQKSVTFKLDEDAHGKQGTTTAPKETEQAAAKGPAPPSSSVSETPSQNAEGGVGMKVGGFGGLPVTSGIKLAGIQPDKSESAGGLKLGGVALATSGPGGSLKLGGELEGMGSIPKLGGVTMTTNELDGGMKHGGVAMTTPGLSGGLKLGGTSSASTSFGGVNLSFSNNTNVTSSGGLKLDGGLKLGGDLQLKPLPPLPVTMATSSALTVSKETASGVPSTSGVSSGGTAFGLEGAQQSSSVGLSFGAAGMKSGFFPQPTPSTETKGSSSGLVFGSLKEGGTEQAAASSSAGVQVPSFLSPFQKEGNNLFASSLKSGASLEQKLSNPSSYEAAASSGGTLTLGGGLFTSPGAKPFMQPHGGTAPQLALSSLSATPSTTVSGLSGGTLGGGLFSQSPAGLQLAQHTGSFGLPESKPLQGLNTGPGGGTTATFQFGGQASSGTSSSNPFAAALAPSSQQGQSQPLSSTALSFFGQQPTVNAQQASSGGFAGGLALGEQKVQGGGGGGLFSGLQSSSTLAASTGATPAFNFGAANLTPSFAFGSGNANPNLSQSVENPFLKSPGVPLNFTSPPTNTEPGPNVFSAAATKNSRIVKRAVRRGRR